MFPFTDKELLKVCQYTGLLDSGLIRSGLHKSKRSFPDDDTTFLCHPISHCRLSPLAALTFIVVDIAILVYFFTFWLNCSQRSVRTKSTKYDGKK